MIKKPQTVKTHVEISSAVNNPLVKLMKQVGIESDAADVINAVIRPLVNLLVNRGDEPNSAIKTSITLISASNPKSQSELMLATQLAMTHLALGRCGQILDRNYSEVNSINSLGNLYTKLSRLGVDQINTLERMKGKGQQKIIVEKINIGSGGRAAIGVYEGVGGNAKKGL